ncbi:DNA-binding NarL/FixJ family response regulator [Nocardioides sp. J9]|uniref:response regulator transcription factor n=1 Tax=unclassified Nocardioides TaxID=2615069 RepID=UPI00048E401C|nr:MULTISPECIES: LuxR C-terminal-related transcriptional regulator [unclassified Nocardioides]TWG99157.1 DNA-binding NarL/FixJ family response regulator [Nocardioides sp. J9]
MSSSTSADAAVRRVVLVSDRRLVGQAIGAALTAQGFRATVLDWPERRGIRAFRRRLSLSGARVGVVMCDLRTPDLLYDVEVVVKSGGIPWVVLTDSEVGPRWGTVLAAGAVGVLPTTTSTAGLVRALYETLAGRSPTPPRLRTRAVRAWEDVADEQRDLVRRMELLTHREYEVLGALYDGIGVKHIAEASGVAEATVRSQVKSLRRKLGVDSQLAAVAMYRKSLDVFPRARS